MLIGVLTETQRDMLEGIVREQRTAILDKWKTQECIQDVLTEKGIAQEYFVKHFGSLILDYYIGELRGQFPPEISEDEIPIMVFFARHGMMGDDASRICLKKKNTFIDILKENGINQSDVLFKPAVELFESCFADVLCELKKEDSGNRCAAEVKVTVQREVDQDQIAIIKENHHQKADEEQLEIIKKHREG